MRGVSVAGAYERVAFKGREPTVPSANNLYISVWTSATTLNTVGYRYCGFEKSGLDTGVYTIADFDVGLSAIIGLRSIVLFKNGTV